MTNVSVETRLLTAEEYWTLYGEKEEFADGKRLHYELINGEVVDVPMPGYAHSTIQRRLAGRLGDFVDTHKLGDVMTELHSTLAEGSVRVPDILFIRAEKVKQIIDQDKPLPFAPDLAIEIISPSNTDDEMQEKLDQYFAAGTEVVWLIYPKRHEVVIYRANGTWQTVKADGIVEGGTLLPGFSMPVAAMFPADQPNTAVKS